MAKKLGAIARAEGFQFRKCFAGIEDHITRRCSDEAFKERLRKVQEEDRDVLKDLGIED